MNTRNTSFYYLCLAALLLFTVPACDTDRDTGEVKEESPYESSAGTSMAITKAKRKPQVELILDEMNYIGIGEDINVILAGNVLFQQDKSDVLAKEHPELDKLGKLLEYYPNSQLRITGYAPDAANATKAKQLAQARANAVKKYMIDSLNVEAGRIQATESGVGDETNAANEKQQGQRVEVLIIASTDSLSGIIRDSVKVLEKQQNNR
ncbi:MAG: OmpA family protein [Hymenobacteraceae bacterium]|nr:OmpA family protein [Hymenobacteraceae bacterium]MDX5396220.1 OmpA family protein [Hymenobacteraceae bacterium]MDX5442823.1 OmpA family protein [Hymenobacteraceae bacterium]MDX5512283.1 OmpA family protein [Hymenobacteraceae bacterium]